MCDGDCGNGKGGREEEKEVCLWSVSMNEIGIQATPSRGCLADEAWRRTFVVPCHHSFFHHRVYIDLPYKKLTLLRTVFQGQFGYIDLARYDTVERSVEVYVKRPIQRGQGYDTPVFEPYLQHVVREGLARLGLPDHVPRVLEVFSLHSGAVCFAMEEVEGATTMEVYLGESGLQVEEISERIREIVRHVAAVVWAMNDGLFVNHRDLKPSNFLLRRRPEAVPYHVTIGGKTLSWETTLHLSLIDFGFACAGSMETHEAHLSLSTVYSRADPCPKDGRDMFLFLGYLYSDYHAQMTIELRRRFESWLSLPGSDLCGFLRKEKNISKRWLYYLSGNENVFQLRCSPSLIFEETERT